MNGPRPTANVQLTADNLAQVPRIHPIRGQTQQPLIVAASAASESVAESALGGATGSLSSSSGVASEISFITEAYSAEMQAQIVSENPVTLLDEKGRPSGPVQQLSMHFADTVISSHCLKAFL